MRKNSNVKAISEVNRHLKTRLRKTIAEKCSSSDFIIIRLTDKKGIRCSHATKTRDDRIKDQVYSDQVSRRKTLRQNALAHERSVIHLWC